MSVFAPPRKTLASFAPSHHRDERFVESSTETHRLWLGIYLPVFPLEALAPEALPFKAEAELPTQVEKGQVEKGQVEKGRFHPRSFDQAHATKRLAKGVIEADGNRPRIVAINEAAFRAGARVGMYANAAWAMAPGLELQRRDATTELASLEALATWAGQYTSMVNMVGRDSTASLRESKHHRPSHPLNGSSQSRSSPRSSQTSSQTSSRTSSRVTPRGGAGSRVGLVLEIGASLTLFGGLRALSERIRMGVERLGYTVRIGVAPTPLGAWLLAQGSEVVGKQAVITHAGGLAGGLALVPVNCLDLSRKQIDALHQLGLRRLGDCARLPRDGLTRRFGPGLMDQLDRALGRRPDPRAAHPLPEQFERSLALPFEVDDREVLLAAVRRLFLELNGFLTAKAQGVQSLELHFAHAQGPATRLVLNLAQPTRDPERLCLVLKERLDRLMLPSAVGYVGLRAQFLRPLPLRNEALFHDQSKVAQENQTLLDRLRARLGRKAVLGVEVKDDHRPERAWARTEPMDGLTDGFTMAGAMAQSPPSRSSSNRPREGCPTPEVVVRPEMVEHPVWLLESAQRLPVIDDLPCYDGKLTLVNGPQRIEAGWWDGGDVARDYFIAVNAHGERLWIYRDRRGARQWYLHGLFG